MSTQTIQNITIKNLPNPTMKKHVFKAIEKALQTPPKPHLLKPDLPAKEQTDNVPVSTPTVDNTTASTEAVPNAETIPVQPIPTPSGLVVLTNPLTSASSSPVPQVSTSQTPSSVSSQVSKVPILDYEDDDAIVNNSTCHEIGLIADQTIEKGAGYRYEITTQNPDPIQYMSINIVSSNHMKYSIQMIPYENGNVYNNNSAQIEVRNLDKNRDYHFSIQYIAYF